VERLEPRALLAADLGSASSALANRLSWGGRDVDVRADTWVVTAPALSEAGLDLATTWRSRSLGEGFFAVTAPGSSADDMVAWASRTAGVDSVEPDVIIASATMPNDPSFGRLWGLDNTGQSGGVAGADIDATRAWDVSTGSRSVVVAVIDTGVDYRHADLAANMWRNPGEVAGNGIDDDRNGFVDDVHGWDFANGDGDPFDDEGHGTHVAGTIGAVGNNGVGVTGVNWAVSIMALKFLGSDGSGSTSDAIAAINYATRMRRDFGVNVVATNNSWGGGGSSAALRRAIQAGGDAGILFVAAAGNEGVNNDVTPSYPANDTSTAVIAVAATDRSNRLASFSNYGATSVDLAAPGAAIYSTVPGNGYASYSGTSMATPHVTGAVALLAAANSQASGAAIRSAILGGATRVPSLAGKVATGGVLDVAAALTALGTGTLPVEPTPPTDPTPDPVPDPTPVPDPPAPPPGDSGEPNDSLDVAVSIDLSRGTATTAGTIGDGANRRRDVDLFAVSLTAGDVLTVDVDAAVLGSGLDSYLRLFDASGWPLAANDDADGSLDSALGFIAPQTGTYYVGLSAFGNTRYDPFVAGSGRPGATTGDYVLAFEVASTALTADVVDVDPDPRSTAVDIVIVDFSDAVDDFDAADLTLMRDGQPMPLAGVDMATVDGMRWVVSGLAGHTATPGRYTIAVEPGGVTAGNGRVLEEAAADSWLVVADTVGGDVGDTLRQAAIVTATSGEVRVVGQIGDSRFRSRDVDLYRVTLAAGQSLSVDVVARLVSGSSSLDSYLRLFDSRGRQLASNDDSGGSYDSALAFTALRGGVFFIGVSGYGNFRYNPLRAPSGRFGSTGAYELALAFGSTPSRRGLSIAGFPDAAEAGMAQRLTAFAQFGATACGMPDASGRSRPLRGR
jgi:subtilisin family serine protease